MIWDFKLILDRMWNHVKRFPKWILQHFDNQVVMIVIDESNNVLKHISHRTNYNGQNWHIECILKTPIKKLFHPVIETKLPSVINWMRIRCLDPPIKYEYTCCFNYKQRNIFTHHYNFVINILTDHLLLVHYSDHRAHFFDHLITC